MGIQRPLLVEVSRSIRSAIQHPPVVWLNSSFIGGYGAWVIERDTAFTAEDARVSLRIAEASWARESIGSALSFQILSFTRYCVWGPRRFCKFLFFWWLRCFRVLIFTAVDARGSLRSAEASWAKGVLVLLSSVSQNMKARRDSAGFSLYFYFTNSGGNNRPVAGMFSSFGMCGLEDFFRWRSLTGICRLRFAAYLRDTGIRFMDRRRRVAVDYTFCR
jgi:hypothetical protein